MPAPLGVQTAGGADLYAILSLSPPAQGHAPPSVQRIKEAYHRALILHHPDKSRRAAPSASNEARPTVDEITLAFNTLRDENLRRAYDRQCLISNGTEFGHKPAEAQLSGIETVDLDDMLYDEGRKTFSRSCRCGKEQGFHVEETQLEASEDVGEILVGCQGCSLWIKIVFAVAPQVG